MNIRDHKIAFEDAKLVFYDPRNLMEEDRVVDGEQRWLTYGWLRESLIVVCHNYHADETGHENFHIISARKATKRERALYESEAY